MYRDRPEVGRHFVRQGGGWKLNRDSLTEAELAAVEVLCSGKKLKKDSEDALASDSESEKGDPCGMLQTVERVTGLCNELGASLT
jgi:hypothetical protein